jgi:hypothetical protein
MKTTPLRKRSSGQIWVNAHTRGLATLIVFVVGVLGACGSSSSSNDAFKEFEGTWKVEFGTGTQPSSTFTLTCPTETSQNGELPLWDRLVLEPGTVSDLVETAGPSDCQFAFDVTKLAASVTAVDPYSGKAPTCSVIVASGSNAAGDSLDLLLDIKPVSWVFNLNAPVKGQAPPGQLIGSAQGVLTVVDLTANTASTLDSGCTYVVQSNLTKIAN